MNLQNTDSPGVLTSMNFSFDEMAQQVTSGLLIFTLCLVWPLPIYTLNATAKNDTNFVNIRVVNFLCYRTTSLLSYLRLKPPFDIAFEEIQNKLKDGIYNNFNLSVTFSLSGCEFESLGDGAQMYFSHPYDVIFGPPSSRRTIGEYILTPLTQLLTIF